jgi:TolB-like protein/Tfp pilus assembly protein PilF
VLAIIRYLSFPSSFTSHSLLLTQEAQPPVLPLPDDPSIVVLPFTNLSDDPAQEYFSDGLTAEITNTLSHVASLFVIARTSAFTYKGKAAKVQDISRELGVRYVLEGSARKTDGQLRVLVQLIDATTGGQLWSESYERSVQDIFAIQDEIVQKIGTTLKLQFPLWEFGLPIRKRTSNIEAYDYFLRGLAYCCRFTKEANVQGRQLFEHAVKLDPEYAEAYAWLGWTYFAEWLFQWSPDPQNPARALVLIQKAIALDDALSWGHRMLSSMYVYQRQYEQSIAEAERALALGPNEADNYTQLTETFLLAGQPERAIGYGEQALRFNPRTISFAHLMLGWAYRSVGRYEEAIVLLKKFLGQFPNQLGAHLNLACAYQESGREEEARAEVAQVMRLNPNYSLETLRKMNIQKDPVLAERSLAALRKAGLK